MFPFQAEGTFPRYVFSYLSMQEKMPVVNFLYHHVFETITLQIMIPVFLADEKCNGHDKCQRLRNADRTPDTVDSEPDWKCQDHDDLEH